MGNLKMYFLCTVVGLSMISICGLQTSIATTETYTTTVEDGGTGPFKAILASDDSLPAFTIYRPKDLSVFNDKNKLQILAWGNGGCSNSNAMHQNYLSEIASHGILVVAIGPAAQGGAGGGMGGRGGRGGGMMGGMPGGPMGAIAPSVDTAPADSASNNAEPKLQLIQAIDWAIAQNSDEDSIYYNKIDTTKIAVAGHSCGGLQALEVSPDPRITTTLVVDSGILNTGGGAPAGGAPRGAMPGARAGAPGAGAAPGGAARGAMPGARAGAPDAGAARGAMPGGMMGGRGGAGGGMPGARGGARGGAPAGGGGMSGMPSLTKEHLTKLHGSVLYLLGGESDVAYANGMDDFQRIEKIPVFVADKGVGHGGTFSQPHGGDWARVSSAWLKWQLQGDEEAGKLFTGDPCELAETPEWTVLKKNIP